MESARAGRNGPSLLYAAKGSRVFVSGLMSVSIPAYLQAIGSGGLFVGVALAAILAGNAASNIVLNFLRGKAPTKKILQGFSGLMVIAGVILAWTASPWAILLACFMGNVSTTGTEAGPFQSAEAGILPELVPEGKIVRAFGRYNFVGYLAAAFGTSSLSVPGLLGGSLWAFRALFLAFAGAGALLLVIYATLAWPKEEPAARELSKEAKGQIVRLSAFFSVDAFGGAFVSQYLLSYWFFVVYGVPLTGLAAIFFVSSLISAASTYGAALIAERIGNLRTMVFTHIPSGVLLLLTPLAGSLVGSVAVLFLRQSLSQMDVPTRQALMAEMFEKDDRVQAYAATNVVRSLGTFGGGPVATGLIALGAYSGLLYAGGLTKIGYDLAIYSAYRKKFR
ncbi:MAG: MFS transporter [archaeon]|nr:MAG: MFS transporter [archaeon]